MSDAILMRKGGGVDISDANSTPPDVLSGTKFFGAGSDELQIGTMANRGVLNKTLGLNETFSLLPGCWSGGTIKQSIPTRGALAYTPGTTNQVIASGQYLAGDQTIKGDSNLIAKNIRSGIKIFGVTGNMIEGKRVASGTATSSASPVYFTTSDGSLTQSGVIEVDNLGFRPSVVLLECTTTLIQYTTIGTESMYKGMSAKRNGSTGIIGNEIAGNNYLNNARSAYFSETGFAAPVSIGQDYNWIAYE